ncbi:MAG: hypothetical protein V3576_07865 [Candidatus Cloacimonadota bacterium]
MSDNKLNREIGSKGITEKLTHEQRKELMNLMKRMLPPVPSKGIIDIRFSFWFFRRWYIVLIFGRDTRNQFISMDRGDMDKSLTSVAKLITYLILVIVVFLLVALFLYLLKSYAGINIFPEAHLGDMIRGVVRIGA